MSNPRLNLYIFALLILLPVLSIEGKIGIVVNKDLYPKIAASITRYQEDLRRIEGKDTWLEATTFSDADNKKALRDTLRNHYNNDNLEGVVFVGDLPLCDFYEEDEPRGLKDIFPCDLYFMDLNGTFTPEDLPDTHSGNKSPEIWVSRIVTSVLTWVANRPEEEIVQIYFDRVHLRMYGQDSQVRRYVIGGMYGEWPSLESENRPYLGYNNNSIQTMRTYSDSTDPDFKIKWANALNSGKEYAYIYSHAGGLPYRHKFGYYVEDIYTDPTNCRFYNVYCCQNARFTTENMCGVYATEDQGLISVGSAKTGSMRPGTYRAYNEPLGRGYSFGESFKNWFNREGIYDLHWHYGMTMQGVGTLRLAPYRSPNDNRAPSGLSLSNQHIDENAGDRVFVGTLTTTDPDAVQTHTYSLTPGSGDADNPLFLVVDDSLFAKSSLDFEQQPQCSLRLRTTDNGTGALWRDRQFIVTVRDVNEAPTALAISNQSVAENSGAKAFVGTFTTTDPEAYQSHIYSVIEVIGDTTMSFLIEQDTLFAANSLDYEAQTSYDLRIKTTDDGGLFYEDTITISVLDVNEAPTAVALSAKIIDEHAPALSPVGTFQSVDPDVGQTHVYTLVDGAGGDDNSSFIIVQDTLKAVTSFDFEIKSLYYIRVRSTDNGQDSLAYDTTFIVSVVDINEAPHTVALSQTTIQENQPQGAVVGFVSCIDPDTGQQMVYTFVNDSSGKDNACFAIHGDTLVTDSMLDYETQSILSIHLRGTDNGTPVKQCDRTFQISVLDVNEAPSMVLVAPDTITENAPPLSVVGLVSVKDQDTGQAHTIQFVSGVGDDDNAHFLLSNDTVQAKESFDFETKNLYTIRIRATDNGSGNLWKEKVVLVSVKNMNETPTTLSLSNNTIKENSTAHTLVGTLTTIDPDTGQAFLYSLADGPGGEDNAFFNLENDLLKTKEPFDFEKKSRYAIRLRTSEDMPGGYFLEKSFTIAVMDCNEQPLQLALSQAAIKENCHTPTEVGLLSATDPDTGQQMQFSLVSGEGDDHNKYFAINNTKLVATTAFNFEEQQSLSVRIRVSDNGSPVLYQEAPFAISVVDVNEAPDNISLDNNLVMEKVRGASIGVLTASDPDLNDRHTFSIADPRFEIQASRLMVSKDTFLIRDSIPISLTLTAKDEGGLSLDKEMSIQVFSDTAQFIKRSLSSAPNPAVRGQPVRFRYNPNRVTSVEMKIFDAVGNLVYTFPIETEVSGVLVWNLENKLGRFVGGGTYVALLRLTDTTGKTHLLKTFVGVISEIHH